MEKVTLAATVALFMVAAFSRRPITSVLALAASFFLPLPLTSFTGGLRAGVFASDVVLIAVLLRWGTTVSRNLSRYRPPPGTAALLALLFLVVLSRTLVVLKDFSPAEIQKVGFLALRFAAFALTFIVMALLEYDVADYKKLVTWICILVTAVAVGNLLNRFGIADLSFGAAAQLLQEAGYAKAYAEERVHVHLLGFSRASLGLLAYVGLVFLLLCGWLGSLKARGFLYVSVPLVAIMLLDSFSRAAIIATVVAICMLLVCLKVRRTLSLIVTIGIGAAVVVLLVADIGEWSERFSALFSRAAFERSTGRGRVLEWTRLLDFLTSNLEYLLFGNGFWNYSEYKRIGAASFSAGHNMYVHSLGELGLAGLSMFLTLWTTLLVTFYRLRSRVTRGPAQQLICSVILAMHVGVLASGVSQESLYPNPTTYTIVTFMMFIFGVTIGTFRNVPAAVPGQTLRGNANVPYLGVGSTGTARV